MSVMEMGQEPVARAPARLGGAGLAAFTLAIFTSAFLLFAIQPMFTKMVLPRLGGSPAVWSVAMVFFQALLLGGYLYAHLLTRHFSARNGALVHLTLLLATTLALPIGVSLAYGAPPSEGQAFWLIGLFLASVGLPFFAVAGNGPLLQAWFARSGHKDAADPYFLYGASNLGSFAALILYPIAIEPLLPLAAQAQGWTTGFAVLIGLIALAAFAMRGVPAAAARPVPAEAGERPAVARIVTWIALAFVPSGLLVAVTAHLSTDVAAAPFLWVLPLALFLLTFVLLFRDRPLVPMPFVERILPILAGGLALFSYFNSHVFWVALIVHVGFFFAATLVCHHRLYRLRPEASRLTDFYLWMSFGGVLGGLFGGLFAPLVFNRVLEYPILVVASVLALPAIAAVARADAFRQVLPAALVGGVFAIGLALVGARGEEPGPFFHAAFLALTGIAMLAYRKPVFVAAMLATLFFALDGMQRLQGGRVYERSFFGVHKLETVEEGRFRVLAHGTTIHGAMRLLNSDGTPATGRPTPLTYYHPDGGIADALRAVPERAEGRRIGVVGLGAGAHACNGTARDEWTYFEIDAAVERIARDPKIFRFLSECAPSARVVLGDARLTLADEPAARFDTLLIDAFSSDAIPVHLLTREAIEIYRSRLAENGVLVLHISNRHLELESVVAALARETGLAARIRRDEAAGYTTLGDRVPSVVVALSAKETALAPLSGEWRPLTDRGVRAWSDDFSDILGALWRRYGR